jgi:hypothetical protein
MRSISRLKLYRRHDRLLTYKQAVFDHLTRRWRDLFNITYDVLLYDLTSRPCQLKQGWYIPAVGGAAVRCREVLGTPIGLPPLKREGP